MDNFKATILFFLILLMALMAACEGPAGPQGPQGNDGTQGPQGETGPGARIINISLGDFIEDAKLSTQSMYTINTPEPDTAAFEWAAVFDTTLSQVAVADTEVVFVYADLPELGFTQLPINIEYQSQRIDQFNDQPDSYNYQTQSFFTPFSFDLPASSLGMASKEVYGAIILSDDFSNTEASMTLTFTENYSELNVRTLVNSGFGLDSDTQYEQALATSGFRFQLDSDISNSTRDDFITTDANGEFVYDVGTDQLSALKDTLDSNLDAAFKTGILWALFAAPDADSLVGSGAQLLKNPFQRNLELVSQWSADSIRVTGYMSGLNIGNDPTAYVNTFPIDIRIIIIGGNSVGKRTRIPYEEVETFFSRESDSASTKLRNQIKCL